MPYPPRRAARPIPRPAHMSGAGLRVERQAWVGFLALAQAVGDAAARDAPGAPDDLAALARHTFQTGKTPFPVAGMAAAKMAGALTVLAEVLARGGGTQRARLGVCVATLAKQLDGLLTDQGTEAAQATWGRQFKDD